jgi:hypothetical protein
MFDTARNTLSFGYNRNRECGNSKCNEAGGTMDHGRPHM